jgi:adenylate cyclase
MSQKARRLVRVYLYSTVGGMIATIGYLYALHLGDYHWWMPWMALAIVAPFVAFVMVFDARTEAPLRRAPFLAVVLLRAAAYLLAMLVCAFFGIWVVSGPVSGISPLEEAALSAAREALSSSMIRHGGLVFGVVAMITLMFLLQLDRKLGPGVLFNWLVGRYHRPREQERVLMFLDIRGSTRLAEQLGHLRFSALVRDFFNDLTSPVLETKGEVSHYIGDEAVLSWTMPRGRANANCVRCFYRVREVINRAQQRYREAYGLVPDFKAGLHCGPVVITEVGVVKSEIVFHGDTLNTTSRIQAMCNTLDCELLASGELMAQLDLPGDIGVRDMGTHLLEGKHREVRLFCLSPTGTGPQEARTPTDGSGKS